MNSNSKSANFHTPILYSPLSRHVAISTKLKTTNTQKALGLKPQSYATQCNRKDNSAIKRNVRHATNALQNVKLDRLKRNAGNALVVELDAIFTGVFV